MKEKHGSMDTFEYVDLQLTFDLQTDSPVGQTSGLCTFWQCWAGIPDSPRTG